MDNGERLIAANARLKAANVGASIVRIGNHLYIQATLPPKPQSQRQKPYQQKIAVGLFFNPHGLIQAEKEARKVGALLACREFSWEPYLKSSSPQEPELVKDWIAKFEEHYFIRRQRSPKSQTTWDGDYLKVFRHLPPDERLSVQLIQELIAATTPDTRTRRRYCVALAALAKFADLEFDPKPFAGRYNPRRVTPRDLPDDRLIAQWFFKIGRREWQWAYGMLATYGLRPHELFWIDFNNWGSSGIVTLLDGKTGPRRVWPIFPEWVEDFELLEVSLPKITGKTNSDYGNRVTHAFKRFSVPFQPYDLRHCWAIRSLEFGLDISLAAQQMGHSVRIHTDLYHLWISDRHHQKAFEALMLRSDRPKAPLLIKP